MMHLHRRRQSFGARGFTMLELLIVVAIVGMLAALAVAGYVRYIHHAQSTEARITLGQIRSGEESYRADMLGYLAPSSSMIDYYPNAAPDDSRTVWERPLDPRYNNNNNGWAMLNVHPDAPVRYGYAVFAGIAPASPPPLDPSFLHPPAWATTLTAGTPWFEVAARNSHQAGVPPSVLVAASYDGTIYSENDDN